MNFRPETLSSLVKKARHPLGPGAALAVVHDGKALFQGASGLASVENPSPLTPQSVFNTGSLAKQFTAYALLWLQQQRKLRLDDEARRYIPELPNYSRQPRLRQLLWHTSGLRCYTTLLWWAGVAGRDNYSRKQSLELVFRQKELNFAPGEDCLYSNSNYLLLSEIVQRVSGKSIADFCAEKIFKPLGMRATHFRDKPSLPIPGLVSGHWPWHESKGVKGEGLLVNRNLGAVPGVGRLMTNLEDLSRWERFFIKPRKPELGVLRGMLSRGWLDNGAKVKYGGGLIFQRYRGLDMQRHDGISGGCRAEFCRFPQKGVTIIALSNHDRVDPTWLARQAADSLWGRELEPVSALGPGQPPAPPPRPGLKARSFSHLNGLYRAADQGPFARLSSAKGVLVLEAQGLRAEFLAESAVAFQGRGPSAIYRLDFEEDGGFILTKQGRAARYARLKPLSLPEARLERYCGRYASPEMLSRLDVAVKEGRLVMSDPLGFEWELDALKGGAFHSQFRELRFSKRGMLMASPDAWVRRLKWVRL